MQWLDDDIDDIFRNAARLYTINTQGSNWNRVSIGIKKQSGRRKVQQLYCKCRLVTSIMLLHMLLTHNPIHRYQWSESTGPNNAAGIQFRLPAIPDKEVSNRGESRQSPASIQKYHISIKDAENQRTSFMNISTKVASNGTAKFSTINFRETHQNQPIPFPQLVSKKSAPLFPIAIAVSNVLPLGPARIHTAGVYSKQRHLEGLAGIDVSNVHFQKPSHPGWLVGLRFGTTIYRRWTLESGVIYEQKSYFSEGEYFNTKLFPNAMIQQVQGTCHMLEIPLNVGFILTPRSGYAWILKTGLSSYLMQKENYFIDYTLRWPSSTMHAQKTYLHSKNNWFSVASVSAAYRLSLKNSANFQIEPYIRFPLQGLGKGQLPISSAGLTVGWLFHNF